METIEIGSLYTELKYIYIYRKSNGKDVYIIFNFNIIWHPMTVN